MEDDNEEIVHLLQKKHLTQNDANDATTRELSETMNNCASFLSKKNY